ncbi:AraC-type DNA-binding protein [Spirosomataceae bacterium TFI 002]|nr:AraC-type DNA-binding protein [Spirosomataceae bacterium TFI 002]
MNSVIALKGLKDCLGNIELTKHDELEVDCNIWSYDLRNIIYDGSAQVCEFESDHLLFTLDSQIHQNNSINFNCSGISKPMICIVYNSGDAISLKQASYNYTYKIDSGYFAYMIINNKEGLNFAFRGQSHVKTTIFFVGHTLIHEKYKCDEKKLPKKLRPIDSSTSSPTRQMMSPSLRELATRVYLKEDVGIGRRIKLEGTCFELFSKVISEVSKKASKSKSVLKTGEIQKIIEAASILEKQYSNPPNQKELTRILGINKNKLTKGFKMHYGTTINDFLATIRMNKAKSLIISGNLKLQDVANQVGLGNASYFSRKFKSVHGMLPSELMNIDQ